MNSTAPLDPRRAARSPIVLLLAAVLFINYVDRGTLAIAAPLIRTDLHIDDAQMGALLSAFFWTYVSMQIPVGWLAERFGAHRVLAAGLSLWAVATMLMGTVHSFAVLVILRLLLGLGESAGFPCVSKLLALVVPPKGLGTANGIVSFAYLFGPAVGAYVGYVICMLCMAMGSQASGEVRPQALGSADELHEGRPPRRVEQLCRALYAHRGRWQKGISIRRLRTGGSRCGDLLLPGGIMQGEQGQSADLPDLPDLRARQCEEQVDRAADPGRIYRLKHRPRRLMRSLTTWIILDSAVRRGFTDGFYSLQAGVAIQRAVAARKTDRSSQ